MDIDRQPGTARHGNFINYYSFNPAGRRIELLPSDLGNRYLGSIEPDSPVLVLDIGCNTGELTSGLHEHISKGSCRKVKTLGVDINSQLILRSQEQNPYPEEITFHQADIMEESQGKSSRIQQFLATHNRTHFDFVSCFSTTMWIHLHHGDEGLREFLHYISSITKCFILEPQPWKCYRNAVRRMKKCGADSFPCFNDLEWRTDVNEKIPEYLTMHCGMSLKEELGKTEWGRVLHLYRPSNVS